MKIITYKNTNGKGEVELLQYYVADDGKMLTNGTDVACAIPVASADGWTEIDAATDEPISDADALEIITGGTT